MGSEHISGQVQMSERPCPVCPDELGLDTMVEPEVDGDHVFFECPECGYAFGYQRIDDHQTSDDCQLGIPEPVRRAGSMGGAPVPKQTGFGSVIPMRPGA